MNHPGEIARLAAIAAPTVALVNNAQREHHEFMASVEAVARENGAAIAALGADGIAVFPADDAHAPTWRELAGARPTLTFALDAARPTSSGQRRMAGDHWAVPMQTPAGAATLRAARRRPAQREQRARRDACALAAGCPLDAIVRGLEAFAPVHGRSQARRFARGGRQRRRWSTTPTTPTPIRSAPRSTCWRRCRRRAGSSSATWARSATQGPAFHREVGAYANERGIDSLWTAGAQSTNTARAVRRRAPLRRRRGSARRAGRGARVPPRCWSRARASCAWNTSWPHSVGELPIA